MDKNNEINVDSHIETNLKLRRLESFRVNAGPYWPNDECSEEEVQNQLESANKKLLFPGNLICAASGDVLDGNGTKLKCGWIVSKVMGRLKYYRATRQYKSKFAPFPMYTSTNTIVEVHPLRQNVSVAPVEGEKVAAYVTYVSEKFLKCRITHNHNGIAFQKPNYRGTIKAEDAGGELNASLLDKFHPGDTIFAIFRNERSHGGFNLRTNRPDLGIIVAKNDFLIPINDVISQQDNELDTFLRTLKRSSDTEMTLVNGHRTKKTNKYLLIKNFYKIMQN